MSIIGHQHSRILGSRCYFQRDPVNGVTQPIIDLGIIQGSNPTLEIGKVKLRDADGGILRTVAEEVNSIDESYEITTTNLNLDNLALLFMAEPPTAFAQAATPVTNAVHAAQPGRLVKIRTSTAFVYGIASIDAVTGPSGTPTYVLGTDYEVVSLERGLIRMLATGSFAAAGNIEIDYTPRVISGTRLITPHNIACSVYGTAMFVWSSCNNNEQMVREAKVSFTATSGTFQQSDFSTASFALAVLSDLTKATPAGRLLYWLGNLPTAS